MLLWTEHFFCCQSFRLCVVNSRCWKYFLVLAPHQIKRPTVWHCVCASHLIRLINGFTEWIFFFQTIFSPDHRWFRTKRKNKRYKFNLHLINQILNGKAKRQFRVGDEKRWFVMTAWFALQNKLFVSIWIRYQHHHSLVFFLFPLERQRGRTHRNCLVWIRCECVVCNLTSFRINDLFDVLVWILFYNIISYFVCASKSIKRKRGIRLC